MFTQIVVPLDGSSESNVAVAQACVLARVTGAHITIVHVHSGELSRETRAVLDQASRECGVASVPVEEVVVSGDAADAILKQVDERRADLVVMRTRGHAGIGRAILGSVAERIVMRSPTPVLLLAPRTRPPGDAVRTILVPVDGSPGGALALGAARELASATGARLRLLQVVIPAPTFLSTSFAVHGPIYIDPSWDVDAEAGAQAYVERLTGRLSRGGVQADGEVLMGHSVSDAVVRNANEFHADLIVMSTEAHTGVRRALFGSVTDSVVRTAECPVLVLRRVAEEDGKTQDAGPADAPSH